MRSTGQDILLHQGHSCLIPAAIADYDVVPTGQHSLILDAYLDNMDRSITGMVNRLLHITEK